MPSKKYEFPPIGTVIDDMTVTKCYHNKNKKRCVQMKCNVCNRIVNSYLIDGVLNHRNTIHGKFCGKSRDGGLATQHKRFHTIWDSMRERTTNVNSAQWKYYGGKGIQSEDFKLFVDFYDQMYPKYLKAIEKYGNENVISLDRIGSNKDYTVNNCRFISLEEQQKNKSRNKWFEAISPEGRHFIENNKARFCQTHPINRLTLTSKELNLTDRLNIESVTTR